MVPVEGDDVVGDEPRRPHQMDSLAVPLKLALEAVSRYDVPGDEGEVGVYGPDPVVDALPDLVLPEGVRVAPLKGDPPVVVDEGVPLDGVLRRVVHSYAVAEGDVLDRISEDLVVAGVDQAYGGQVVSFEGVVDDLVEVGVDLYPGVADDVVMLAGCRKVGPSRARLCWGTLHLWIGH